ncbi:hypothetical protein [Escherichia phage FL31]
MKTSSITFNVLRMIKVFDTSLVAIKNTQYI